MSIAQNAGNEFFPLFDIFGKYYILHPAKGSKYTVCADHSANDQLKLQPQEITEYYKDYLINVSMLILSTVSVFMQILWIHDCLKAETGRCKKCAPVKRLTKYSKKIDLIRKRHAMSFWKHINCPPPDSFCNKIQNNFWCQATMRGLIDEYTKKIW